MHPFPHRYQVHASATPDGDVPISAPRVPTLQTAPPVEFDGPGDRWSPESLLCAAVADCFVLSFRAVAKASKFEWRTLACDVEGTLNRVEGKSFFTHFVVKARLQVPAGTDHERATRLLEKSEQVCLISSSLVAERKVEASIEFV
jgi:organic hydroperoxide reductase OsmC/OhrA